MNQIYSLLRELPTRRRAVILAFSSPGADVTVRRVAESVGLSPNTVRRYISITKARHPAAYQLWRFWRSETKALRRERSAKRRRRHTDQWFRKLRRRERGS
jgi:hypothetical protein